MTPNGLAQAKALIRFYFRETPEEIEDVFCLWQQLKFSLEFDGKIKTQEIITR
jgi:hypothetical protein